MYIAQTAQYVEFRTYRTNYGPFDSLIEAVEMGADVELTEEQRECIGEWPELTTAEQTDMRLRYSVQSDRNGGEWITTVRAYGPKGAIAAAKCYYRDIPGETWTAKRVLHSWEK